ncbi:hypothetical protein GOBAR_DD36105 [Gossypium barbadense]|nr:hypothetical protein GOBAR_DD36105 [Gossypium barbadense]
MAELSVIGVCMSISKGGLRLKRVELQNQSFLMKVDFNFVQKKGQLWAQVLGSKYKWEGHLPIILQSSNCSRLWKGVARVWSDVRDGIAFGLSNFFHGDYIGDVEDFPGWKWDKKRKFTIKLAYQAIASHVSLVDESVRKHMALDSSCGFCGNSIKDANHVLRGCIEAIPI